MNGHLCEKCGLVWGAMSCLKVSASCSRTPNPCPMCEPHHTFSAKSLGVHWQYIGDELTIYVALVKAGIWENDDASTA